MRKRDAIKNSSNCNSWIFHQREWMCVCLSFFSTGAGRQPERVALWHNRVNVPKNWPRFSQEKKSLWMVSHRANCLPGNANPNVGILQWDANQQRVSHFRKRERIHTMSLNSKPILQNAKCPHFSGIQDICFTLGMCGCWNILWISEQCCPLDRERKMTAFLSFFVVKKAALLTWTGWSYASRTTYRRQRGDSALFTKSITTNDRALTGWKSTGPS